MHRCIVVVVAATLVDLLQLLRDHFAEHDLRVAGHQQTRFLSFIDPSAAAWQRASCDCGPVQLFGHPANRRTCWLCKYQLALHVPAALCTLRCHRDKRACTFLCEHEQPIQKSSCTFRGSTHGHESSTIVQAIRTRLSRLCRLGSNLHLWHCPRERAVLAHGSVHLVILQARWIRHCRLRRRRSKVSFNLRGRSTSICCLRAAAAGCRAGKGRARRSCSCSCWWLPNQELCRHARGAGHADAKEHPSTCRASHSDRLWLCPALLAQLTAFRLLAHLSVRSHTT